MNELNRREFLKGSSALLTLASFGLLGMDFNTKSGPLKVALIGAGWYGKSDLFRLIQVADVEVVALCDVDKKMLTAAGELVAQRQKSKKVPELFEDYRELLQSHACDLVVIGSPDHWHALQAIEAMKSGAHVYLQKPISVDVIEGEAILAAARKYKRKCQIGTQRKSTPHLIEAKKRVIDSGLLGKISHAEVCCYYHMRANGNPQEEAVPDFFNYEMWTGPAPLRPYDGLPHTRWWRTFMEYGNGIVGDMCIHMLDTVRWMLELGWPTQVASQGGILVDRNSRANISDTQSALFDFGDLKVTWNHRTWGDAPDPKYPWGATIYGDQGTLRLSVQSYDFQPRQGQAVHKDVTMELEEYPEDKTEKDLEKHVAPAIRYHMLDFLKAIADRSKPVADIEQGHISTTSCILANLSMELGRSLTWDPKTHQVVGDEEATRRLRREYRGPWEHPEPDAV